MGPFKIEKKYFSFSSKRDDLGYETMDVRQNEKKKKVKKKKSCFATKT